MRIILFVIALALITFGAAIGVLGLLSPETLPRLGARDGLILLTAGLVIFGIATLVGEIAGLRADLSRLLYILGGRALAGRRETEERATHAPQDSPSPSVSIRKQAHENTGKSVSATGSAPSVATALAADKHEKSPQPIQQEPQPAGKPVKDGSEEPAPAPTEVAAARIQHLAEKPVFAEKPTAESSDGFKSPKVQPRPAVEKIDSAKETATPLPPETKAKAESTSEKSGPEPAAGERSEASKPQPEAEAEHATEKSRPASIQGQEAVVSKPGAKEKSAVEKRPETIGSQPGPAQRTVSEQKAVPERKVTPEQKVAEKTVPGEKPAAPAAERSMSAETAPPSGARKTDAPEQKPEAPKPAAAADTKPAAANEQKAEVSEPQPAKQPEPATAVKPEAPAREKPAAPAPQPAKESKAQEPKSKDIPGQPAQAATEKSKAEMPPKVQSAEQKPDVKTAPSEKEPAQTKEQTAEKQASQAPEKAAVQHGTEKSAGEKKDTRPAVSEEKSAASQKAVPKGTSTKEEKLETDAKKPAEQGPTPPPPAESPEMLYIVKETVIRGRPARILSDGTIEAELEYEGWLRFEDENHLNEYLDALEEMLKRQ